MMTASAQRITIGQGENAVVAEPDVVISTLLGSCIAVCLHDAIAKIGGMNHFLLGEPGENQMVAPADMQRYGVHAMELLINALMKAGAKRSRLRAHLYGGANIIAGLGAIGSDNARFAERFMATEQIPVDHADTGGRLARRIDFRPFDGKIRARAVTEAPAPLAPRPLPPTDGEIFLF